MPIYEYECESCGNHLEAMQRFSDAPLTECDKCHGILRKLISHSSFHLKGTGWYVTDYAAKSRGTTGSSEKKESDSGSAKEKTTSETKEGGKTGD